MEAMEASGSRLCQIIQGSGLWPRTAQHFQTVLATAGIVALADAGFASHMDDMMVNSICKFTVVKKHMDELVVPEVATNNVHLEAVLAVQRLTMQETVDLHIHVYEEIVYIGHYKASEDGKTLAFFQRMESLDAIVQKHVDLATKAATT
ncbi:hypothetical protein VPH35_090702 [Triticum aestivum]